MSRRVALLIGISDYAGATNKLPFCQDDLEAMNDCLSRKGFTCVALLNPELELISTHLDQLVADAAIEDDVILFYFSGHGFDVIGEQVLLGKNFGSSSIAQALKDGSDILCLSEVIERMSSSASRKLIVIDACRSAAVLTPNDLSDHGLKLIDSRRSAIQHISNCVIAYSSAEGQVSEGRAGHGSFFTKTLTKELAHYNCDFVQAVQKSIASLRRSTGQMPWIYASTYNAMVPDRLSYSASSLERGKTLGPDRFIGLTAGKVRGISGRNLLELDGSTWIRSIEIENVGKPVAVDFAENLLRLAVVRGRTVYVSVKSKKSNSGALALAKIGQSNLKKVFGVGISSSGSCIAVFGHPNAGGDGLSLWQCNSSGAWTSRPLSVTAGMQCNAVCFQEGSSCLLAAFSRADQEGSVVLSFDYSGAESAVGVLAGSTDKRVTGMMLNDDDHLVIGDITGQIREISFTSNTSRSLAREHALDATASSSCAKGWIGEGDDWFVRSPAVSCIQKDPGLRVLAISYYDQTIAFVDLDSWTCIATMAAPSIPRRHSIARAEIGGFVALRELYGTFFKFTAYAPPHP